MFMELFFVPKLIDNLIYSIKLHFFFLLTKI
jgi:hypothetical protein